MIREPKIEAFDLPTGRKIGRKYEVLSKLGAGWEGEVYKILETSTGIERAAKLFYPRRNPKDRTSKFYAKKLHKLRHCPVLIQYHTAETITFRRAQVTALISEYVEGELLSEFLKKRRGKRLTPFEGLHLLYALADGIEPIHLAGEYHGDLHAENVIVNRFGLNFDIKLVDLFRWNQPKRHNQRDDICDLIQIFHEAMGGAKHYAKLPAAAKYICCGLKRNLILKKFRTISELREHLESMSW
jgi:serine/threonine protein kinase